jgi:hypothetical protein
MKQLAKLVPGLWLAPIVAAFAASSPPNIVFVLADDLGYAEPGAAKKTDSTPVVSLLLLNMPRQTVFRWFFIPQAIEE